MGVRDRGRWGLDEVARPAPTVPPPGSPYLQGHPQSYFVQPLPTPTPSPLYRTRRRR
ncbi:hypothetical protein BH10PSE15_BH10PSE15_18130 [soil metagenome]